MPVGLNSDSVLGKCIFCGHRCKSGDNTHSTSSTADRHAFCHNAKWVCGNCAVGMHDRIVDIKSAIGDRIDALQDIMEAQDGLNRSNFEIDMETGKLKFVGHDRYK